MNRHSIKCAKCGTTQMGKSMLVVDSPNGLDTETDSKYYCEKCLEEYDVPLGHSCHLIPLLFAPQRIADVTKSIIRIRREELSEKFPDTVAILMAYQSSADELIKIAEEE